MWGFKEKSTAEKLKRLVQTANGPNDGLQYAPTFNTFLRTYLGHPNGTIPGAARVFLPDEDGVWSWKIRLGKGEIYVHQRKQTEGSKLTETRHYKLRTDPAADGEYVKKVAYNLCTEPILATPGALVSGCPDSLLFCVEDVNGDLYIVKVCTFECPASSSSSSSSESSAMECDGSEDLCVLTGVKKTQTGLAFSSRTLHFRNGKFCYSEPGYCVEEYSSSSSTTSGTPSQPGPEYITINLCDLNCDPPEPPSSSSTGPYPPSSSSGPGPGPEPPESSGSESSSSYTPWPPFPPSSSGSESSTSSASSSSSSSSESCSGDCFCVAEVTVLTNEGETTGTVWAGITGRAAFVEGASLQEKSGGVATGKHGWIQSIQGVHCYGDINRCIEIMGQNDPTWWFE